jgi:bifunctional non-homologous end joining protein LigD
MPSKKEHALERYAAKRSFKRTSEPPPSAIARRNGPLLFVVQKHAARRLHYDLRLELDGVLKSWAVPKGPSLELGAKRLAVAVEDHPFDYASFEGAIPAGEYGGGNVIVWDCGVYSPDEEQQYSFGDRAEAERRTRIALEQGKLSFFLRGEKLKGSFALVRTTTPKQWLLLKHKDRFADAADVLARRDSVLSGVAVEDIPSSTQRLSAGRLIPNGAAESLPKKLPPMLAESSDAPRFDSQWLCEPKLDGYRVIAFIDGASVRLISRRGIDLTTRFPEVVADLQSQAVEKMILDGEVVALSADGRPSFNALQNRVQRSSKQDIAYAQRSNPVVFVCFDLLHFAGINLRAATYLERRRYLSQCLLPAAHLQIVHAVGDAEALYAAAVDRGFEGIVAKRKDSSYQPGKRTPAWRKVKAIRTGEFLVGGYTKGKGARDPLGALLLGYWRGGELEYAGHAGSGLEERIIAQLRRKFAPLTRRDPPFAQAPPLHRPTIWLEPVLVVEVSFSEWTPDGLLRAPVFLRLREDVAPKSVRSSRRSKSAAAAGSTPTPDSEIAAIVQQLGSTARQLELAVGDARIKLTNLDREYWPADRSAKRAAVTKRDLIRYLATVSPYMLPHLLDRPLTMIRMPNGINGQRFYQKHWDASRPDFVKTLRVFSEHVGGDHDYVLANDLPTLLWLGQNGTLEFHVWHSSARVEAGSASSSIDYSSSLAAMESSVLNYPDYLVFDLDPYIYSGKEAKGGEPELNRKGFAAGKRVAFWLRAVLKEMSLEAVVKTSGKTGLHVFVPIERTVTFDTARHICEIVGRHLLKAHPREITLEWATKLRTGKIFIDYNMNVRGKTLNVAYSPRGLAGAPVSMPLSWEELEAAEPMDFRVYNVLQRLEKTGDRWHDVGSKKQSLAQAFGSSSRTQDP